LNHRVPEAAKSSRLFDKYVILHTDDTAMEHRNIHGVDWDEVAKYIEVFLGHPVFRVGNGNGTGGQKINTDNLQMLAYIVGNADYFIGLDSGVSQIAMANNVPSMIFFGSVNPKYRYHDLTNLKVMQKHCPDNRDGCYHDQVSLVGTPCVVDVKRPPCIVWSHSEIINSLKTWIK
jgi:ADP-heptose:LPS heptosyltransferase